MMLLKVISNVTHFKAKPAVGYLLFSFSFLVVGRNSGIREGQIRLSSLTEVLCFMFLGIEFHNMVVDWMKELW